MEILDYEMSKLNALESYKELLKNGSVTKQTESIIKLGLEHFESDYGDISLESIKEYITKTAQKIWEWIKKFLINIGLIKSKLEKLASELKKNRELLKEHLVEAPNKLTKKIKANQTILDSIAGYIDSKGIVSLNLAVSEDGFRDEFTGKEIDLDEIIKKLELSLSLTKNFNKNVYEDAIENVNVREFKNILVDGAKVSYDATSNTFNLNDKIANAYTGEELSLDVITNDYNKLMVKMEQLISDINQKAKSINKLEYKLGNVENLEFKWSKEHPEEAKVLISQTAKLIRTFRNYLQCMAVNGRGYLILVNLILVEGEKLSPEDHKQLGLMAKLIEEGDISKIRANVTFKINDAASTSKNELLKIIQRIEELVPTLYLPYEVTPFATEIIENESEWDANYYYSTMANFKANFSKERLLHVIDVHYFLIKNDPKFSKSGDKFAR